MIPSYDSLKLEGPVDQPSTCGNTILGNRIPKLSYQTDIKYLWIPSDSVPPRYVPFTGIHSSIFKLKYSNITFKTVRKNSITTLLPLLHIGTRLFRNFTKKIYQGHMLAFFIIAASNERCPRVDTLHLKCFPIKGEPRLVENISCKG